METYKKRIEKCTTLDELFVVWKEAHQKKEYYEKTISDKIGKCFSGGKEDFAKNWTNDGFLDDHTGSAKILFVLKEPNQRESIEKKDIREDKPFWIKEQIMTRRAIPRRLRLLTEKYIFNGAKNEEWFKQAAVMNLNKRGGLNYCNHRMLSEYIKIYKPFIKKQIEIINPEIIVFLCGVGKKEDYTRNEIIEKLGVSQYTVYYGPHPACRGKDEEFKSNIKIYE